MTSTTTRKLLVFTPWRMETRSWSAGAERDQPGQDPLVLLDFLFLLDLLVLLAFLDMLELLDLLDLEPAGCSGLDLVDVEIISENTSDRPSRSFWGSEVLPEVGFHSG